MSVVRDLIGKNALITGGAGGLGSGSAQWLARDGASVTLMGRTEEALAATAELVRAVAHPRAEVDYFVGDAMVAADVQAAVEHVTATRGGLDITVAVVGGGVIAPLLLMPEDTFANELNRNVVSAFLAIKHSPPAMVERGGGSIVCISSDASTMSWPFMAGYCAGKAGLDALVRVAADELGHLGVRVNAVRPGLTRTTSNNSSTLFSDEELIAEFARQKALGRTGTPDDVGAGVRYLAGPESSWVTGASIPIEGGAELRRAPSLEKIARARWGDARVEAAMAGRPLPEQD